MKGTVGNTEWETEFDRGARELGKDAKEEWKQNAERPDRKYEIADIDGQKEKERKQAATSKF